MTPSVPLTPHSAGHLAAERPGPVRAFLRAWVAYHERLAALGIACGGL